MAITKVSRKSRHGHVTPPEAGVGMASILNPKNRLERRARKAEIRKFLKESRRGNDSVQHDPT